MTEARAPLSKATQRQKELEALALELSREPAVQAAREAARQQFLVNPKARTPDGAATLEDAATQHFYGALQLALNLDPHNPEVASLFMYAHETDGQPFPSALHGGLENPDNVYRLIPVSSDSRYELRGVRRDPPPAQVTYELMDAIPGIGGIGHQVGLLMDHEMQIGPDGSFTVTLDSDPADGRPNHIQTNEKARALFVRDTMSDWANQTPDKLEIVRLSGPETPPRTREQLLADAVWLIGEYARFWIRLPDDFVARLRFKTNAFDPAEARTGGWGYIANTHYAVGDDEALVFTADPGRAPYHAVLVANHWWIAMDADLKSGSFNTSQAQRNGDGTITYVVANRDPGAHNWLDTGGTGAGIIQVRWQGGRPGETPRPPDITDARVVKLDALKASLPPGTAWLTPEERRAQLAARHASYLRRLHPE